MGWALGVLGFRNFAIRVLGFRVVGGLCVRVLGVQGI